MYFLIWFYSNTHFIEFLVRITMYKANPIIVNDILLVINGPKLMGLSRKYIIIIIFIYVSNLDILCICFLHGYFLWWFAL